MPATSPTIDHQTALSRSFRFEEESCESSKAYDRALAIRKRVNLRQQVLARRSALKKFLGEFERLKLGRVAAINPLTEPTAAFGG